MKIKTVLCPIDFSSLADYELDLAAAVCQAFGAHLVLHHNLAAAGPGFAKAWEWEKVHHPEASVDAPGDHGDDSPEAHAQQRMAAVLARLPEGLSVEARISRGPVGLVLTYLIEEISADLVILGSHGWSSEEHASLSERVIERAPCPVLTFQEGRGERPLRLDLEKGKGAPRLLVPIDFSESTPAIVDQAVELARMLPCELHLLYVVERRRPKEEPEGGRDDMLESRLWRLVPGDLAVRAQCHVVEGPVGDQILASARDLDAAMIVMGEHARGFLRHFFTRDTAREMLHRAPCPVWYVPPVAA